MNTTRLNRLLYRIGGFGAWQRIQFLILTPSLLFVCWSALLSVFLFENGVRPVPNSTYPDNPVQPYANYSTDLPLNDSSKLWYEEDTFIADEEPNDGCSTHFIQEMQTAFGKKRTIVCTSTWMRSAFHSFFALGNVLGVVMFYLISKRFGRKPVVIVCTILYIMCGIASPFLQLYVLLMIFRFFTGLFASGIKTATLLISLEIISSVYHWQVILLWSLAHGIGYVLVTAIWALFAHWQASFLVCYLLCIALLLYLRILPESVAWLFVNKHRVRGACILKKIAANNGHALSQSAIQSLDQDDMVDELNRFALTDILRDKLMLRWSLLLSCAWILLVFIYYNVSLFIPMLDPGHIFEIHVLAGFAEIIACIPAAASMHITPKYISIVMALCGSILHLLAAISCTVLPVAGIICGLLAKACLHASFIVTQIVTLEMYPLDLNIRVFIVLLAVSEFGSALASLVAFQALMYKFIPFVLCTFAGVVIIAVNVYLPGLPPLRSFKMERINEVQMDSLLTNNCI